MTMYGIAIIHLIGLFDNSSLVQKWYEGYGNAVASLGNLKSFFDSLKKYGPAFGYHLTKCLILTKELLFEKIQ